MFVGCTSVSEDEECLLEVPLPYGYMPEPKNNEIYYTTTDDKMLCIDDLIWGNVTLVSHTYENGVGCLTFDGMLNEICPYAFGCSKLSGIKMSNCITSIGEHAFEWCDIHTIIIPDGVHSIGKSAFAGCKLLWNIHLPEGIMKIEGCTFEDCTLLESINIPSNVISIGDCAFYNCWHLTSITIPRNVTYIGMGAFEQCENLATIYCQPTTPPSIYFCDYSLSSVLRENSFPLNFGMNIYVPQESHDAYMQYSSHANGNTSPKNWYKYEKYIKPYDYE